MQPAKHSLSRFRSIATATILLAVTVVAPQAFSQGCIPAHYLSLSLGALGISYLQDGEWEASVGYRYLHSERVFIGAQEHPELHPIGGRLTMHSIDLSATYALNNRFSLNLTVPFMHADYSLPQGDGQRHTGSASGLGDLRLVGNVWLWNPPSHRNGNIALGLGVKFPTGDDNATGNWHYLDSDGETVLQATRPVDIAAQTGDGGFGIVLHMQAFQKIAKNLYGYASGFYLSNPREQNGTEVPSLSPLPGHSAPLHNSVPDQYFARVGLNYVVWPSQGLSLSLGGRIDGVPVEDLIGGSEGFRRAGFVIYIDPGLNWVKGKNSLSLNVPIAVERHIERTLVDLEQSEIRNTRVASRGGFADYLIVVSYSRRF